MNAIDTLRDLVEQAKWKCDEDPGCPTCAAEDAALADVEALLQAAERLGYAEFESADEVLVPKDDFDALAAAVRKVKGEA